MGFQLDVSIPAVTVFLQGLISFFSPCVLPLLPLYIGYLSGGTGVRGEDGKIHYHRGKVMANTLFFVAGVSFAFFLLGLGMTAVGSFFHSSQAMFARIGGVLIVFFGLYQLGVFGTSRVLGQERRLPFQLDKLAMSPVTALLMGFTFSFAWTPCVGPALTSVLLMAASAASRMTGFVLIGVYTLGFVLPFLAVGLFTTTLLEFFKKHRGVVQYTVKIGGLLMIAMGLMMFTGKMNDITGYLSQVTEGTVQNGSEEKIPGEDETEAGSAAKEDAEVSEDAGTEISEEEAKENSSLPPAIDFELKDQYGNTHRLSDYKGKTVFLNFWATWCPPCKAEMPDIQKLYETYDQEGEDALIVLGVAAPGQWKEQDEEGVKAFLEDKGYTYPVLMDSSGTVFLQYGVSSYPTTFMIDRDGNVFGYVPGMLSFDMMESIVKQTMTGVRSGE
jgi:cytochrome c-type biogenesis protein